MTQGTKNGKAKLTEVQVLEILALKGSGLSQRAVAARYGVVFAQIGGIWNGTKWRHLTSQVTRPRQPLALATPEQERRARELLGCMTLARIATETDIPISEVLRIHHASLQPPL